VLSTLPETSSPSRRPIMSPPVSVISSRPVSLSSRSQLVGPQEERHVGWVLEVHLADDARAAVAGALVVCWAVLLQPEHPIPPAGELVGGAPHPAETRHDHVVLQVCLPALRILERWRVADIALHAV
jgi:hypothetical protein